MPITHAWTGDCELLEANKERQRAADDLNRERTTGLAALAGMAVLAATLGFGAGLSMHQGNDCSLPNLKAHSSEAVIAPAP